MDLQKTGAFISRLRREGGMTQKQLAEQLHISDRTVSKWERGAGFPDVSLLEPLSAALDVQILDLLRGERTGTPEAYAAVSEAVAAFQEKRRQSRREWMGLLGRLALLLAAAGVLMAWMVPVRQVVRQTVPAGLYHNGQLIAWTEVEMEGEIEHMLLTGERLYYGSFAIDCIPWTAGEEVMAEIYLNKPNGLCYLPRPGENTHALYDPSTVISRDMREFAMEIRCEDAEGMYLLASSPAAYQAYQSRRANVPPLASITAEPLPIFPDCR